MCGSEREGVKGVGRGKGVWEGKEVRGGWRGGEEKGKRMRLSGKVLLRERERGQEKEVESNRVRG